MTQPRMIIEDTLDGYGAAAILQTAIPSLRIHTLSQGHAGLSECEVSGPEEREAVLFLAAPLDPDDVAKATGRLAPDPRIIPLGTASRGYDSAGDPSPGTRGGLHTARALTCLESLDPSVRVLLSKDLHSIRPDVRRSLGQFSERVALALTEPGNDIGMVLRDVFAEHRSRYVPEGHSSHHRFVGQMLLRTSALAEGHAAAAEIEQAIARVRHGVIDDLLKGRPPESALPSVRRLTGVLLADPGFLHEVTAEIGQVKIAWNLRRDRILDLAARILADGSVALIVGIDRAGQVQLVSRNGLAERVRGVFQARGSGDTCEGFAPPGRCQRRSEAIDWVCQCLGVDRDSQATITLTLSEDAVTYDILDDGLPLRLRGQDRARRRIDALLIMPGRTREQSYADLERLKGGTTLRLTGRWDPASRSASRIDRAEFHASGADILGPGSSSR